MTSSMNKFWVPACFVPNSGYRLQRQNLCRSSRGRGLVLALMNSVKVNGCTCKEEERVGSLVENGKFGASCGEKMREENDKLDPMWDDGYGTRSMKDLLALAQEIMKPDGGPPRWFCPVSSGRPLKDSPILLYLPGLDGLGVGLVLHEKALGKAFEVRCLHIPVCDQTSFEDLTKFVEATVRLEHVSSPNKPIYMVGDSFGGCLALAVAARSPTIDLVVILVNPATSFGRSQLQPVIPLLEALPQELFCASPHLLSFIIGNPMKLAISNAYSLLHPVPDFGQLCANLAGFVESIPKGILRWKLKLLRSAADHANSRLHAITSEVLVLASGKDNIFPSIDEAHRLSHSLKNCKIRNFRDSGHTILLEDGVNLLTVIKGASMYRRSQKHDYVKDFLPPSMSEYKCFRDVNRLYLVATCPVLLSTLEDGNIVRGLAGIPDEGPVLLVGYHMLMGLELIPLVLEILREKNIMVRGVAHPDLFSPLAESISRECFCFDIATVFGALPVTASNLFKLFSTKSYALLYPGGAREALHRKGEQYQLFWPDQPEFVRMAARFGATIVPFGAIGEDDISELAVDYNDMMGIPVLRDLIRNINEASIRLRAQVDGEISNQEMHIPVMLPKVPGRLYFLFGKPVRTKGSEKMLRDKEAAKELYIQIKSEVEQNMTYLIKKREEDPYRGIVERIIHGKVFSPIEDVPTFEL